MGKFRVVLIAVAIVCGLLAGVLAKGMLGKKAKTEVVEINKVPMTEILIASKDMSMGEKLADSSMSWSEWPKSNVSGTMITKDSEPDARTKLVAARARLPIYEGEPISERKLILPDQTGFMSAILPKGMRAISVAISERSAAGGFILPNDRVDVILTRKIDSAGGSSQKVVKSETVLTNVRVLAINQTYRQEGDDKVTVTEGKTATLELNPRETEVISMIESAGEISLALRSIAENDGKGIDDSGPRLSDRYSGKPKSGGNERLFVRYGIESYSSSR